MPHALTDLGNARRLVDLASEKFRYIPAWHRYAVWNGHCWEQDGDGTAMLRLTELLYPALKLEADEAEAAGKGKLAKRIRRWRHESQATPLRQRAIKAASSILAIQARPSDFDSNAWLLAVKNGTIDLRTGELHKHRPGDMLTGLAPVMYRPTARCPTWERYLAECLPDADVRAFVQRYIGYALTGSCESQVFMVWIGEGANGKSVALGTLLALLGPYATPARPEVLLARGEDAHPTGLASLFGKRLVTTSEMRAGRTWDEEKVKGLTGADPITCRRMREDFWSFTPTHKIIVAANHRPRVTDTTASFWRRVALVEWPTSFEGRADTKLPEKVMKELPGILNWAIEGCLAWQRDGLAPPAAVQAANAEYRTEEDVLGRFIAERLFFLPGARLTSGELWAAAKKWQEETGCTIYNRDLPRRLATAGSETRTSNGMRYWSNVRLRTGKEQSNGGLSLQVAGESSSEDSTPENSSSTPENSPNPE